MSSIPTKHIDGDVSVGRNIASGGDATVRGNAVVDHDLKVGGWLDAPNIKSPCKGMFARAEELREVYPNPEYGWWALVGASFPADVWYADDSGWVASGGKANPVVVPDNDQGAASSPFRRAFVTDVSIYADMDCVEMEVTQFNPAENIGGDAYKSLPMADEKQAGFMSASQARQLKMYNMVFANYEGTNVLTGIKVSQSTEEGLELLLDTYDLGDEIAHPNDPEQITGSVPFVIPAATEFNSGVMSPDHVRLLVELEERVRRLEH